MTDFFFFFRKFVFMTSFDFFPRPTSSETPKIYQIVSFASNFPGKQNEKFHLLCSKVIPSFIAKQEFQSDKN